MKFIFRLTYTLFKEENTVKRDLDTNNYGDSMTFENNTLVFYLLNYHWCISKQKGTNLNVVSCNTINFSFYFLSPVDRSVNKFFF